jgi:Zn-finger nucleic acid-binding protein
MRDLECPTCHEPMMAVAYGGVEIDSCPGCDGIWLDGGELEALTGQAVPPKEPDPELGAPDRECPVCVESLVKERYGSTEVVVDRCPGGDGVWLDPGELQAILAAYEGSSEGAGGQEDQAGRALRDFFDQPSSAEQETGGEEPQGNSD